MRKNSSNQFFAIPAQEELLEVLDGNDKPLLIMPRKQALQQKLPLKVVLVVVRNKQGKIYIHRRAASKSTYAGTWAVSAAGYVKAGESFEDAALRELAEELSISGVSLRLAAVNEPSPETDNSLVALFLAPPAQIVVNPDPGEIECGMFVDEDELRALLRDMPELLSPALKWAAGVCDLFG